MRVKSPPLTDEQKQYILDNYKGNSHQMMANKLGVTLWLVRRFYQQNGLHGGITGHYEKGHVAWSRGKKLQDICSEETMKRIRKGHEKTKGHCCYTWAPVGRERDDGNGYIVVKCAEPPYWRYKHRMIYEELHNVKLTKDDCIWFLDGNKRNYAEDNMVLLSRAEAITLKNHSLQFDDPEINRVVHGILKLQTAIRSKK